MIYFYIFEIKICKKTKQTRNLGGLKKPKKPRTNVEFLKSCRIDDKK